MAPVIHHAALFAVLAVLAVLAAPCRGGEAGWQQQVTSVLMPVGTVTKAAEKVAAQVSSNDDEEDRRLFPMSTGDIVGSVLCLPIAMLAAGAGLGGGPLFIPLLIVVVEFSVSFAIPLSKAMIFGVAIAQFLINVGKRSVSKPNTHALIDYDVALLVEPMTLLGTTWGVFLNIIFPDWFTVLSISILLLVITSRTSVNSLRVFHRESDEEERQMLLVDSPDQPLKEVSSDEAEQVFGRERRKSLVVNWGDGEVGTGEAVDEKLPMWRIVLNAWPQWAMLCFTWLFVFTISLLKGGGEGGDSVVGVKQCSWLYWMLVLSEIPVILGITLVWGWRLQMKRQEERYRPGAAVSEVDWNLRNRILFPSLSFFAGVVAGMMGLGGGMIKSPLLLELGKNRNAPSASATCAFMILFTSSSTTVQYLILGRLNLPYAVWFGVMGFAGSLVGKIFINALVKRYRKTAYIILCVAVFLGLGTLALITEGVLNLIVAYRDKAVFAFSSIC